MINQYVVDIALEMGMHVPQVSVAEGLTVGCSDVSLLNLTSGVHRVNALVYHSELDNLQAGNFCDRLEARIRIALSRLQSLSDQDLLPENACE